MRNLRPIVFLGVLCVISGCFKPEQDCHVQCDDVDPTCPDGFTCVIDRAGKHVCAAPGDTTCAAPQPGDGDGGSDITPLDLRQPPPTEICLAGPCFPIPQAVRDQLVLLLDPSTLPAIGQGVTSWMDRSGYANHAWIVDPSVVPVSNGRGVTLGTTHAAGFMVANAPTLNLGTEDFVVLVEATSTSLNTISEFFFKSNISRPAAVHQIEIAWLYPTTDNRPTVEGGINDATIFPAPGSVVPPERLITLRRSGTQLALRLNGAEVGTSAVTPGDSVDNDSDLFLGIPSPYGISVDGLGFVMVIHGPVATADLVRLESFLKTSFNLAP